MLAESPFVYLTDFLFLNLEFCFELRSFYSPQRLVSNYTFQTNRSDRYVCTLRYRLAKGVPLLRRRAIIHMDGPLSDVEVDESDAAAPVSEQLKISLAAHAVTIVTLFRASFDNEGDDVISRADFANGLQQLGLNARGETIHRLYDGWDIDGNGSLTLKEVRFSLPLLFPPLSSLALLLFSWRSCSTAPRSSSRSLASRSTEGPARRPLRSSSRPCSRGMPRRSYAAFKSSDIFIHLPLPLLLSSPLASSRRSSLSSSRGIWTATA